MFFIPLNQMESVQLVINALRIAGGEAGCSSCPASRACAKQCLAIAAAVDKMFQAGTLPSLDPDSPPPGPDRGGKGSGPEGQGGKGKLTLIK